MRCGRFSLLSGNRTRGNELKLQQGQFSLDLRKNWFPAGMVQTLEQVQVEAVESPPRSCSVNVQT